MLEGYNAGCPGIIGLLTGMLSIAEWESISIHTLYLVLKNYRRLSKKIFTSKSESDFILLKRELF